MNTCTWFGCLHRALYPQLARDGSQWANLCAGHDAALHEALEAGVMQTVAAWVKAQGGPEKAAERM